MFKIEEKRARLEQLDSSIEQRTLKAEDLERRKQELLDASTEIRGVDNLDERTRQIVLDAINTSLGTNAQEAKQVSDEMNQEMSEIAGIKDEVNEASEETKTEIVSMEQKQSLLQKLGLDSALQEGIKELQNSLGQMDELKKKIEDQERSVSDIARRLSSI